MMEPEVYCLVQEQLVQVLELLLGAMTVGLDEDDRLAF